MHGSLGLRNMCCFCVDPPLDCTLVVGRNNNSWVINKNLREMDVLKFNCSGCGSCCRRVGGAIEIMKNLGFPYEAKEDGSCTMLSEDGKCKVYDNRPEACNIEAMYKRFHEPLGKKRSDIFRMEAEICNTFMKADGVDEKFRLDPTQYNN